jgi:hypothetical protein
MKFDPRNVQFSALRAGQNTGFPFTGQPMINGSNIGSFSPMVSVAFPLADTPTTFTHNLGRIPRGFIVVDNSGGTVTYPGGGGGGGTVSDVVSPDGSIAVTNPTGPTVDIEALSPFAKYQALVASESSLIHWWKLAETGSIAGGSMLDSVGTANGTYSSVANPSSLFGGPAASCSMGGGTGNLGTLGTFTFPTEFTIEVLFYLIGGQGNSGVNAFLSSLTNTGSAGVEMLSNGTSFQFGVGNGGGGFVSVVGNGDMTIAYGLRAIMTLVANTNTSGSLAGYINGWPLSPTTLSGFTPGTLGICLGQRSNTGTFSVNGTWSNVSVYNTAFSGAKVQSHVQALGL